MLVDSRDYLWVDEWVVMMDVHMVALTDSASVAQMVAAWVTRWVVDLVMLMDRSLEKKTDVLTAEMSVD